MEFPRMLSSTTSELLYLLGVEILQNVTKKLT